MHETLFRSNCRNSRRLGQTEILTIADGFQALNPEPCTPKLQTKDAKLRTEEQMVLLPVVAPEKGGRNPVQDVEGTEGKIDRKPIFIARPPWFKETLELH